MLERVNGVFEPQNANVYSISQLITQITLRKHSQQPHYHITVGIRRTIRVCRVDRKLTGARAREWWGCTMGMHSLLEEVKFLTVAEVATLMRVSKMTVYRLVHSGDLAAVRVGRSFRVPQNAVQEYLTNTYKDAA